MGNSRKAVRLLSAWVIIIAVFLVGCSEAATPADSAVPVESVTDSVDEHGDDEHDDDEHGDDEHGDDEHGDDEHGDDDSAERRELGVHEHGAATLTLAWSGSEMQVELDSPAYNMFGFEYEPQSDAEKEAVADGFAVLEGGEFLGFNADAGCTVEGAEVVSNWGSDEHGDEEHGDEEHGDEEHGDEEHGDEEHGDDEHGDEEAHADVVVTYVLTCSDSEAIETLDLSGLFGRFPNFTDLDVQWISDTAQSAAEATSEDPIVTLR